jgi:hypothetical protein
VPLDGPLALYAFSPFQSFDTKDFLLYCTLCRSLRGQAAQNWALLWTMYLCHVGMINGRPAGVGPVSNIRHTCAVGCEHSEQFEASVCITAKTRGTRALIRDDDLLGYLRIPANTPTSIVPQHGIQYRAAAPGHSFIASQVLVTPQPLYGSTCPIVTHLRTPGDACQVLYSATLLPIGAMGPQWRLSRYIATTLQGELCTRNKHLGHQHSNQRQEPFVSTQAYLCESSHTIS